MINQSIHISTTNYCPKNPMDFIATGKSKESVPFRDHLNVRIADILDIPCAYCGKKMLSRKHKQDIINKISPKKDDGLTGKALNCTLRANRKYVIKDMRGIFDEVVELSLTHPDKIFKELVELIYHKNITLADNIEDISEHTSCVFKNLQQTPNRILVNKFFEPLSATNEHIIPSSNGGTWEQWNMLAVHQQCNSSRGNIPLGSFIGEKKYENLLSYLDILKIKLKERGFSDICVREYMTKLIDNIGKNLWKK